MQFDNFKPSLFARSVWSLKLVQLENKEKLPELPFGIEIKGGKEELLFAVIRVGVLN